MQWLGLSISQGVGVGEFISCSSKGSEKTATSQDRKCTELEH
jgi:hypothetical protein